MSKVRVSISVSLDGYAAGPDQSERNPLGIGGERLHEWVVALKAFRGDPDGLVNESTAVVEHKRENIGAFVMGRNMFGPIRGDWGDESWTGWWGEEPPYHAPVFVLTHHPRENVEMKGGTTFHFVTEGLEVALARAREAAGDADVEVSGGASVVRQALAAGAVDELTLSVTPVILGSGERPIDDLAAGGVAFEQDEVVVAPGVTHLRYRVV